MLCLLYDNNAGIGCHLPAGCSCAMQNSEIHDICFDDKEHRVFLSKKSEPNVIIRSFQGWGYWTLTEFQWAFWHFLERHNAFEKWGTLTSLSLCYRWCKHKTIRPRPIPFFASSFEVNCKVDFPDKIAFFNNGWVLTTATPQREEIFNIQQ